MRGLGAAEEGGEPFWRGLAACDEAFGAELVGEKLAGWRVDCGGRAYDAGGGIDAAGEGIDSDDVRGFLVPGTVFTPVCRRDFVPRVVEVVLARVDLHGVLERRGEWKRMIGEGDVRES